MNMIDGGSWFPRFENPELGRPAIQLHIGLFFFSPLLVLFFRIAVFAGITLIAACAIAGFADFLFRGQFITFASDGHGVHSFGILTEGSAIDILRGDLEGVEEQAGAARIDAGAEECSYDL